MVYRIQEITDQRVAVYTALNEKKLKHFYEPDPGLFICESERIIRRAVDAGYEMESVFAETGKEQLLSGLQDIPVYAADKSVMKQVTGSELTGGLLAAMRRKKSEDLSVFLSACHRLVVLEDIENPTNVGAIFRSAAALGADGVLLTKGSSDPLYRRAARVSMGTVFSIRWCFLSCDHMAILKDHGFYTIAMALSEHAVDLDRNTLPVTSKRAVILGNEDHGVSGNTLDACDIVVKIPMAEGVDSLNVSAAAAVACWEVFH